MTNNEIEPDNVVELKTTRTAQLAREAKLKRMARFFILAVVLISIVPFVAMWIPDLWQASGRNDWWIIGLAFVVLAGINLLDSPKEEK